MMNSGLGGMHDGGMLQSNARAQSQDGREIPHGPAQPKPIPTAFLGEPGTEQFNVQTFIDEREIGNEKIHDPFVNTTLQLHWRDCLRGLFRRGMTIRFSVSGSHAAQSRIMTMNPLELQKEQEEWEAACVERWMKYNAGLANAAPNNLGALAGLQNALPRKPE